MFAALKQSPGCEQQSKPTPFTLQTTVMETALTAKCQFSFLERKERTG